MFCRDALHASCVMQLMVYREESMQCVSTRAANKSHRRSNLSGFAGSVVIKFEINMIRYCRCIHL